MITCYCRGSNPVATSIAVGCRCSYSNGLMFACERCNRLPVIAVNACYRQGSHSLLLLSPWAMLAPRSCSCVNAVIDCCCRALLLLYRMSLPPFHPGFARRDKQVLSCVMFVRTYCYRSAVVTDRTLSSLLFGVCRCPGSNATPLLHRTR